MTEQLKNQPSTTNGLPDTGSSRSGKSYNWKSKCGEPMPTKRAIHAHQKQCPRCMSMIRSGPSSGKLRTMYCGVTVRTRKNASEHYQNCSDCQKIRQDIRVQTCKELQHTPAMKQRYSETAKRTSARSDIQAQRAEQLKRWRDANPEAFMEITRKAQGSPKRSKMETLLEPWLTELGFTRNVQLRAEGQRKQVDFVNRLTGTVIEVDGPWHFLPIRGSAYLGKVQQRDRMLDREILARSWRMIRISMQHFKSHTGEVDPTVWQQVQTLLQHQTESGIWCFGSLYESVSWDGVKVTILK